MAGDAERRHERELKVDVPPDFAPPGFDGWDDLADDTVELRATYWDTADLRLLGWGHTLRRRTASDGSEDGWTLKLERPTTDGDVASRDEIDAPPTSDLPPPPLRAVVASVIRREPVRAVAELTTTRHRRRLRDPGSGGVVELADDRVTTVVDGQAGPSFRQIEVELLEGDERALDAAARLLRAAGARTAEPTPKLARALAGRPVATPPTAPGRRPRLRRKASVEDLVRAAVADGAHRLLAHDPGVRVGDDPEDVHQARVATRRLRSDLRTLGPVLDDFRVPGLRQELQWLGERLGAVRDLDVLAGHLRADAEGLDGAERAGADRLLERLDADRRREALTLRDAMASSRYLALLESLDRLVHQPPLRPDLDAGRRATRTARRLLRRADRRAVRFAQGLGRRPDDPSLHELRKRAKGARYAAELVSPLAPRPVHRLARRMADVQDVLGDLQDTVVADDWLQGLSRRQLSPDEAAAAVALGERQRERQEQARQDWRRAWKRASKRGLRRWFS